MLHFIVEYEDNSVAVISSAEFVIGTTVVEAVDALRTIGAVKVYAQVM